MAPMPHRIHPVVLVVEDDPDEAQAIRQSFEQLGYTEPVRVLNRGRDAIDYLDGIGQYGLRKKHPLPDFVLIDLDVADTNAFEILEWLRNKAELGGIRTVVMTTGENVASMNRAYQLGAVSFLTKPLNFSEFRDTIQSLYTHWTAARRAGAAATRN
jgi:CheY-like chemotaxis protein